CSRCSILFYFLYPCTPVLYTLSLHDALPIWALINSAVILFSFIILPPSALYGTKHDSFNKIFLDKRIHHDNRYRGNHGRRHTDTDRKSTRLNSSHVSISYAVFCLKKKKKQR